MFVSADSYDRFMGRYSRPLAAEFARFAEVVGGQRAIDVGCGPGALTEELVRILGAEAVSAVDPSPQFVDATRDRLPGVDVRQAGVDDLPYAAGTFDVALAQLVVHFMADPSAGLAHMRDVTRSGGVVAACVWDFTRDQTPLTVFWNAVQKIDPSAETEANMPGANEGDLGELFASAGISQIEEDALEVEVSHPDFDDWWVPFTLGVGPAGAYVAGLSPEGRDELRSSCRALFPDGPFTLTSRAWAARGRA